MEKKRFLRILAAMAITVALMLSTLSAFAQDDDYGALSRAMEQIVGGWYPFAGGMMYADYMEFYDDGTCTGYIADPSSLTDFETRDWSNPALYSDIRHGIWYIAPYNPAQDLFWNDPPFLLTIVESSGTSYRYGMSIDDEWLNLSTAEGQGGYLRYGGQQDGDGTQQNNGGTQDGTQSLDDIRAQIAGGWYMDIGGALLMDYFELGADGGFAAYYVDGSRIAPDYYSTNWPQIVLQEDSKHGTWNVQSYDPAIYWCWDDPPYLLVIQSGADTVEFYGLAVSSDDALCLSDSMGQGGYRRFIPSGSGDLTGTDNESDSDADDESGFFDMEHIYRVTDGWYSDSQAMMGVLDEFGQYGEMADWNDIVSLYGGDMTAFMDAAGIITDVDVWVQYGGNRYDGSRHYFLARISVPRSDFYLYDSVGNEAWLGSWYGVQMPVLAKVPVDE